MSKERWGYLFWGAFAIAIVIPEALAWRDKKWYWPTVERTAVYLEEHVPWLAIAFLALLAVLTVHLVFYPWPSVP